MADENQQQELSEESELDLDAIVEEGADDPSDPVQVLEAEVADLKDRLLRTMAELDNTRKRAERDQEQTRKFGISNFAKDLIGAADNLRRALESVPENLDDLDPAFKNVVVGIEMTEKELLGAFEKHGIRKIDPLGQPFDYNFHQAMFEIEDPTQPAGTVLQVMQAGYAIDERLLRPAMVGVAKAPPRVDTSA